MKKSVLYTGIGLCCLGAAFMAASWFLEEALLPFAGPAGAVFGVGLGMVFRWHTVNSDDQSDLVREVRQQAIEQRDERNVMLRDKAGYFTMNAAMGVLAAGYLVLRNLAALGRWMPFARYGAWACLGLLALMLLCHWTVRQMLDKRM